MKIAVLNYSGNVGKTTVCRYLLQPRIKDSEIYSVESINKDGAEEIEVNQKAIGKMLTSLPTIDSAIIDVGSSNVEGFIEQATKYNGALDDFDYFIVPTVESRKQTIDTLKTLIKLSSFGIKHNKIKVVFNKMDKNDDPKYTHPSLFEGFKDCFKKGEPIIYENELYSMLNEKNLTVDEVLSDETDYKELIKKAVSQEEKMEYAERIALKRLSSGVKRQLDDVFNTLFG